MQKIWGKQNIGIALCIFHEIGYFSKLAKKQSLLQIEYNGIKLQCHNIAIIL